jgi:hypothetical protein
MDDIAIHAIKWLIVFTGTMTLVSAALWASLRLLTYILKSLGIWVDFIKVARIYYIEKNRRKREK